jgi:hypothetical protein
MPEPPLPERQAQSMASNGANLARFQSLREIASPAGGWSESDAPLARRGMRISWLVGMVPDLLDDINRPRAEAIAEAQRAEPVD